MNHKTIRICALVIFITCVFIAFGSSIASVVLFLYNPLQEVRKDCYKWGTLLGQHLLAQNKDIFYRCQKP